MGCDIHIITEYKSKSNNHWYSLGSYPTNPGRNYDLFAKLSGVRGNSHEDSPIATPGWPSPTSWAAKFATTLRVIEPTETLREQTAYRADAEKWVKSGLSQWVKDDDGVARSVTNPDWHSYGHCTVEQMAKALRKNSSPEYRAMLAAARSLEKDGMDVRFLFFYDC